MCKAITLSTVKSNSANSRKKVVKKGVKIMRFRYTGCGLVMLDSII